MPDEIALIKSDFVLTEEDRALVVQNLTELRDSVWEAVSPNTRKAYQSDFNQYIEFCRRHTIPALASDWKATRTSCKLFFNSLMEKELSHATIKRKMASIRYFIGVSELPDPWKHSKLFRDYINGWLKKKPAVQNQAAPLKLDDVRLATRLLNVESLLELRDALIINMALDTLFRASNILAIKVQHVDWQAKTVFAPRSKTDQSGEGHYGYMSEETAVLLRTWLSRTGISDGFVFRKLSPKQTVQAEAMQYQALLRRFESIGEKINSKRKLTCHSTRTGGVLTLLEANVPMSEIILSGNWKSENMAIRYAKQYTASSTGMAKVR